MSATKSRHMTTVKILRDQKITSSSRAAINAAATLLACASRCSAEGEIQGPACAESGSGYHRLGSHK